MSYFHFLWRLHRGFLLFAVAVIALLQFLILRVVTSFDTAPMISGLAEQIPESFKKMLGEETFSLLSVDRAAAFGLNHPLVLVILAIAAIVIPSRHIAGEAEDGTLELLLSFPVKRVHLLANLFASGTAFLFLIILCALGTSLLSISLFDRLGPDTAVKLAAIACNLWLLFVSISSLTLALSAFGKEGSTAAMRAAGIILVFYLLHYLSSLWDPLRFTKPFNIFSYYRPTALMSGERSFWLHVTVLCALILVCMAVSAVQFNRRDIPG